MKKKLGFGELELTIVSILKRIQPANIQEIQAKLSQNYAYTTIMTVCNRLEKKGALKKVKEGNKFFYSVTPSHLSSFKAMFNKIKDSAIRGHTLDLISYLIEESPDISTQDLDRLEKLVHSKKRKRDETCS